MTCRENDDPECVGPHSRFGKSGLVRSAQTSQRLMADNKTAQHEGGSVVVKEVPVIKVCGCARRSHMAAGRVLSLSLTLR